MRMDDTEKRKVTRRTNRTRKNDYDARVGGKPVVGRWSKDCKVF